MTKSELIENISDSYKKYCKSKSAYCTNCPYANYYDCSIHFTISYLNKRHLIKGITNEKENNKNK